ncbi:MAG: glycosyltransferase [Desulfovibrionaceae bacterium]|nr:glycosyltransferase [Desulfovibrionaceae bacterium]
MIFSSKKKMAIIVASKEWPSYRIYTQSMLPFIEKGFDFDLFDAQSVEQCSIDKYQIILIVKIVSPYVLEIAAAARAKKIPTIYEVDDNFLAPAQSPHGRAHGCSPGEQALLAAILPRVSLVLVYSRKSFERMCLYNPNIAILPTYQQVYTDSPPKREAGPRVVGFMGTLNKELNFAWVLPALQRIAAKYPDVSFEFLGFMPPGAESLPSVRHVPFITDYDAFIEDFKKRNWTVALAPLADTEFNLSKTNIKYREYAAAGYPGIYSNLEPYSNTVTDKSTGLLADNEPKAWANALESLLNDQRLAGDIVKNAWNDIHKNYQFVRYCQTKMFVLHNMADKKSKYTVEKIIVHVKNKNSQIKMDSKVIKNETLLSKESWEKGL